MTFAGLGFLPVATAGQVNIAIERGTQTPGSASAFVYPDQELSLAGLRLRA
jgi:hypothetical protein